MKKVLRVAAVGALALSMVACSGGSGKEAGKTDKKKKEVKVGIAIYNFADNFMAGYRTELENKLKAMSNDEVTYKVDSVDGGNNPTNQGTQIENFINQKYDVLFINLVNTSGGAAIVNKIKEAGIPAVFINREPSEEIMKSWDKISYVGADAAQSGKFQGEIIAELDNKGDKNGDGAIDYFLLQGDPENVDAKLRTEWSVKQYEESSKLKANKLNLVRADWDTSKAATATQAELAKQGDKIEVIFANNDGMAMGAIAAVKAAGKTPGKDVYIVGVDALPEAVKAVETGELNGTVLNDHVGQAKKAIEVMKDLLAGKKVESRYYVDYVKITPKNVKDFVK